MTTPADIGTAAPTHQGELMTKLTDELERRLDAVLKLHANPELIAVHEGYGAEYRCNECRGHHWPCPTVKAARGEQR